MLKLRIQEVGGISPPPAPPLNARVEIWRDTVGAIYAYGEMLGEVCSLHVPGLASFRFSCHSDEIAATVSSGVTSEAVLDAYQRKVLPMALQIRGQEVLHASAVTSAKGVTAFCGVSQTGKSTIAYGLSRRGYDLWGDDALAFETTGLGGMAISLPFKIRLRPSAAKWFGGEAIQAAASAGFPVHPKPTRLKAVCVLRRADDDGAAVQVRRLSVGQAFPAVFAHAWWFTLDNPELKRRVIDNYLDLVARIPVFDVSFKSGLENLPVILDAIEELMAENVHE